MDRSVVAGASLFTQKTRGCTQRAARESSSAEGPSRIELEFGLEQVYHVDFMDRGVNADVCIYPTAARRITFNRGEVMVLKSFVARMFSAGMIVMGTGVASGQDFPNKPIRIVTSGSGSPADIAARVIARGISGPLGQQAIVDNRAGIVAAQTVANAPPDGYTLLVYGPTLWILPFLQDHVPWDPMRDFSPVTWATREPNVLVAHPSVPAKSVKELVALAKARPGVLNYASGALGSSNHLAAELFKSIAGVNIVRVPFKSTGPALNAMIAGELELMFPGAGSASPHVKAGRLRALAVTTAQPTALAPGLPTLAAAGVPGYESEVLMALWAPAGTPATLINRLNREAAQVLKSAQVKQNFFNLGVETVGSSPRELLAKVKSEMARWGKVIRDAGIRAE